MEFQEKNKRSEASMKGWLQESTAGKVSPSNWPSSYQTPNQLIIAG